MGRRPEWDVVMASFGPNLRRLRRKQKLTKTALAEKANVHPSRLSKYESGQAVPSLVNAFRIAKALDQSVDSLCSLSPSSAPELVEEAAKKRVTKGLNKESRSRGGRKGISTRRRLIRQVSKEASIPRKEARKMVYNLMRSGKTVEDIRKEVLAPSEEKMENAA